VKRAKRSIEPVKLAQLETISYLIDEYFKAKWERERLIARKHSTNYARWIRKPLAFFEVDQEVYAFDGSYKGQKAEAEDEIETDDGIILVSADHVFMALERGRHPCECMGCFEVRERDQFIENGTFTVDQKLAAELISV
jgi:hypothetical protein